MHVHFIGICGVAMSALAIAFHKQGWRVSGSDAGFFPPISTHLKKNNIKFYPGWHPEKMCAAGEPNLVVVGNVASSTNPEWLFVKEHHLPHLSYPELIATYLVQPHSIVCAGTYGKTTTAALLAWILKQNNFDPSYMFGGLSLNDMDAAHISLPLAQVKSVDGYSILEGDEYKTSRSDPKPKFSHYSPTHLLLTSVVWDHADVYPTAQSYIDAFQKLFASVPADGLRVISEKATEVIDTKNKKIITYGRDQANDYQYTNVESTKYGVAFDIINKDQGQTHHIQTTMLGEFAADNMTGGFAMAHQIGIKPAGIIKALESFHGLKRRLEKRHAGNITIFDDIAHSPSKAEAILNSLRSIYKGRIIAVFEPNTGNRRPAALPGYEGAFSAADEVIIPRLTKVKLAADAQDKMLGGAALAEIIKKTHPKVLHINDDENLLSRILAQTKKDDVVVFLGSHGFRGMIEELVDKAGATYPHPSPLPPPHHPGCR